LEGVPKPCLLPNAPSIGPADSASVVHVPSVLERIVEYEAKTNSFMGPPFAKTTKVQRALQISKKLFVLEVKTTLADIPFCNRFYVMERWVVQSESHPITAQEAVVGNKKNGKKRDNHGRSPSNASGHHAGSKMTSCAYLTVTSQTIFTQSCPFETTIVKESAKQISDICTQWNKLAQEGLKRTEETRRQRLQEEEEVQQLGEAEESQPAESKGTAPKFSEGETAFEGDESIEIRHMGRRNSWVAGDEYSPEPEERNAGQPTSPKSRLSSSWKGKSIVRQSKSGKRSFSRSISNLLAKSTRRRSSATLSSTTSLATEDPPLLSSGIEKPSTSSSTPVPVVSVVS
jgi:hypothetical protein